MFPINIYALTRISSPDDLSVLDLQLSRRKKQLKIKDWEIQGLRKFADRLQRETETELSFYYSFILPKLGKEFDLLRISEEAVVNIELKSRHVSDEAIRKQLLLNRYYLSLLGKEVYSYTYISEENRLVKLTGRDRIQEAEWNQLAEHLQRQIHIFKGDIETLFKEEEYLISPLNDPERFLRREYFLTSQQYDIKRRILAEIGQKHNCIQAFTGLPGTGKSILLYDIAMSISEKQKICIVHIGPWPEQLSVLNKRLKKIDFYYCSETDSLQFHDKYGAVLIDESHCISKENLQGIIDYANKQRIPVIFSYDSEDVIAQEEREDNGASLIESLPELRLYHLTNRIRVNNELSSFILQMMQLGKVRYSRVYPSAQVYYANNEKEAAILLNSLIKDGYEYIPDETLDSMAAEKIVMRIDHRFWYDEKENLRAVKSADGSSPVRKLYHGLNSATQKLALIVVGNMPVFRKILRLGRFSSP